MTREPVREVSRSLAATRDLLDHFVFIGRDSPAAAERFLERAEETLDVLTRFPFLGRCWTSPEPRLRNVRVFSVRRFPRYRIFYRVTARRIVVVRVIHSSRDLDAALRE